MTPTKKYIRSEIQVVQVNSNLQQISKILRKNKTSGVPVTDGNMNLVGFISERDIIQFLAKGSLGGNLRDVTAEDIMQKKVLSVEEDTPLEYISKLFSEHPFRNIPVMRGKMVVGIINRKDVIGNLLSHYY